MPGGREPELDVCSVQIHDFVVLQAVGEEYYAEVLPSLQQVEAEAGLGGVDEAEGEVGLEGQGGFLARFHFEAPAKAAEKTTFGYCYLIPPLAPYVVESSAVIRTFPLSRGGLKEPLLKMSSKSLAERPKSWSVTTSPVPSLKASLWQTTTRGTAASSPLWDGFHKKHLQLHTT